MKKANGIDSKVTYLSLRSATNILESIISQFKNQQQSDVDTPNRRLFTPQNRKKLLQTQIDDTQLKIFDQMCCLPFFKRFIDIYFKDSGVQSYYKFMKSLRYSKVSKGTLVVKQGDQMNRNTYILLSGLAIEAKKNQNVFSENITRTGVREQFEIKQYANQIDRKSKENKDIFMEGDDIVKFLNEYGPDFKEVEIGDAFGEDVLYEKGPRRSTLQTITDSEFILFDKNSFWKIQSVNNIQKKKMKEIIKSAININYDIYNQNTISQIVSSFQVQKIQKDELVFEEGSINEKVYIIQGSCEISMKYLIKKNIQKSISRDLKGTLVIDNLANGIFFVGDEIIFESWKKYKYQVKVTARNTFVYSCKLKDIEEYYDQATLNHMKEAYLKKMVVYKRKYDQKIQEIIQEHKKKLDSEKISNNSSISKTIDGISSFNKKQKVLKNFTEQPHNKGQNMNLSQFLQQSGKQKNTFQEILQQIQKDKYQTRILEQSTINTNCCFQMQQPVFYTYHRSLTFQPDTVTVSNENNIQNLNPQKFLSTINHTMPLQDTNQSNNFELFSQKNSFGQQINSNEQQVTSQLEQEEWFPQQNDKIFLKKARQKSIRMNPNGTQFKRLESLQEQISSKSVFQANTTDSFQFSQSKILNGEEINPLTNKSTNFQYSFEECPSEEEEGTIILQKELKIQDKQYIQSQQSQVILKEGFNFSTQLQNYQQEKGSQYSKTLPNLRKKNNKAENKPILSPIPNYDIQDFPNLLSQVQQNSTLSTVSDKYIQSKYLQNQNNNMFDFKNTDIKSYLTKIRSQSQTVSSSNQQNKQNSLLENPYSFSPNESLLLQYQQRKALFGHSNSVTLENQSPVNFSQSSSSKYSERQVYQTPTEKQERIKKGLVLSKKENIDYNNSTQLRGLISTKYRRIHDSSPEQLNNYFGIQFKKRLYFQKKLSLNSQNNQVITKK